jgi:peptide/nickel transport system substrate-binding protein
MVDDTARGLTRRTVLGGAAGVAGMVASRPARAADNTLHFVPQADLNVTDPVFSPAFVTRNFGYLVYDTLFAQDTALQPQPQMAEGCDISADRLTYTIGLRSGLAFHDGSPVTAADCTASLQRWSKRDPLGQKLAAAIQRYDIVDARVFRIQLSYPFPLLLEAIGKTSSNTPFIMPQRLAQTDAFRQVTEIVGSGPFRTRREEWVPGARIVFERNAGYRPRPEPPSFAAGGKVAKIDRVEWVIMPDPATAAAALQTGEIDWWEQPQSDLLPMLTSDRNILLTEGDRFGNIGALRFNQLIPPFNDERARRAVLLAVDQRAYLAAMVGNPKLSQFCPSFFTCGTPMATEAGPNPLRDGPDLAAARGLIQDAGLAGTKVVVLDATDLAPVHAQGLVTAALLKSIGFTVEMRSYDWATVVSRRNAKEPADKGGWNVTHSYSFGLDAASPATNIQLRSNGPGALYGWPDFPDIEFLRDAWFKADGLAAQKAIAAQIQQAAFNDLPYIPTGQFFTPMAYRRSLSGIIPGPIPFFWNVEKAG